MSNKKKHKKIEKYEKKEKMGKKWKKNRKNKQKNIISLDKIKIYTKNIQQKIVYL